MSFGEDVATLVSESKDPLLAAADRWERVPLGAVATILNGFPWKSEHFGKSTGVPLIRIRDVTTGATETLYEGPITDGYWVEPGDLLVGMDGDFNVRRWQAERGLLNQRVCKIAADPDRYSTTFLEYVLPSYLQLVNHMTSSVTVKHLSSRTLAELPLPLPPAAEQRRIVAKLDALTARLARARAELDRVAALARNQRDAMISAELDRWAGERERIRFDRQISVLTSGSRDWAKYYDRGSKVFVLASNVRKLRFDTTPKRYIDPPLDSPDARRSKVAANDLLLTIVGAGTGDICHVKDELDGYFVCQSVARISLHDPKLAAFYSFWFSSPAHGGGDFQKAMYGAARPHLSFDQLKGFLVPDVDSDHAIAAVSAIESALARADRLEAEAARARALIDRLESAILAKAFCGELVPQDPNDEPASVLLDRIRAERAAAPKAKRGRAARASA